MTSAEAYFDFSDEKIKTDVETIDNAIEKICDLRGVCYKNIISQEEKIGLIAQESIVIIPEVVNKKELSDTLTVNYENLVAF